MRDLVPIMAGWQARGQRCALASVVRVHGRAPLPVGASLAVAEDGATAGAVSGGCVEQEVIRAARDVMRGGPARRLTFAPGADGVLGLGLPCGGGIDVWVQAWHGAGGDTGAVPQRAFARAVLAGEPAVLTTAMESPEATFDLVVEPLPRLVLVGAGLVAGALCAMAGGLGWMPIVVDPREVIAAHAPLRDAARLVLSWPDEALAELGPLGPRDAVVVLSHQPALDDAALRVAVTTGAGFIGALGSRSAQADRLERLREHGLTAADLARIVGPVGLDLGGWSPHEVAVSIVGELIAARHGRTGGRLSETDAPIHTAAGSTLPNTRTGGSEVSSPGAPVLANGSTLPNTRTGGSEVSSSGAPVLADGSTLSNTRSGGSEASSPGASVPAPAAVQTPAHAWT